MKKYVVVAISLLVCGLARSAFADADSELRAVEESRRAAIKAQDFDTLGKIYAPGFIAAAGNGQLIDRAALFEVFRHTDPALSYQTDEIRVVDDGDTAVFFGRLTARTPDGKIALATRFSHVFVRRNGNWQCIAGQSARLSS